MWSSARLALATELREWALEDIEICLLLTSSVNGSVAIFKADVDECVTEQQLLEMLHKRLDVPQPRT